MYFIEFIQKYGLRAPSEVLEALFEILHKLELIDENLEVSKNSIGLVHYVFEVRNRNIKYFVKIRSDHFSQKTEILIDPSDITHENKIYECMKGIKSVEIPDKIGFFKSLHALVLKDLCEGKTSLFDLIPNISVQEMEGLGVNMKELHLEFSEYSESEWILSSQEDEMRYSRNMYYRFLILEEPLIEGLVEKMAIVDRQLIYADFNPYNVLLSPQGKLALLDLETVQKGNTIFDTSFFLAHIIIEHWGSFERVKELIDAFHQGYGMEIPGKEYEYSMIAALVLYRLHSGFGYKTSTPHPVDIMSQAMLNVIKEGEKMNSSNSFCQFLKNSQKQ